MVSSGYLSGIRTWRISCAFSVSFIVFILSHFLVHWPGIELRPLAVKAQSLNHWDTRECPVLSFILLFSSHLELLLNIIWARIKVHVSPVRICGWPSTVFWRLVFVYCNAVLLPLLQIKWLYVWVCFWIFLNLISLCVLVLITHYLN